MTIGFGLLQHNMITDWMASDLDALKQQLRPGIVATPGWLQHILASGAKILLALEELNGGYRAVGVAVLHSSPQLEVGCDWLTSLVVHSDYQGQGIEQGLVSYALEISKNEHGASELNLAVADPAVLSILENMGFAATHESVVCYVHPLH